MAAAGQPLALRAADPEVTARPDGRGLGKRLSRAGTRGTLAYVMAKATKGSADPRAAAEDLSNRDRTTANSRRPPARLPNGRFAPAGWTGDPPEGGEPRRPSRRRSTGSASTGPAGNAGPPRSASAEGRGAGRPPTATAKPATAAKPAIATAKPATATAKPATATAKPATATAPARTAKPTRPPAGPAAASRPAGPRTEEAAGPGGEPGPAGRSATGEGPDPATGARAGGEAMTPITRKMLQRRRLATLVAFLGLAIAVVAVGHVVRDDRGGPPATTVVPAGSALPAARPAATVAPEPPSDVAAGNPGRSPSAAAFRYPTGYGPVLGTVGPVHRFTVAMERTGAQGADPAFADAVDQILGDPRSWIASRRFRLQRVPAGATPEFTVYLASARTSQRMCAAGGLTTDGYTSCRLPGQVIINEARWDTAVPGYGAPLATYRAYAINHEVGHQLGHGHEACPGTGRPAPVMQQQTYGLKGCVANGWPYIDGRRYAGNPVG